MGSPAIFSGKRTKLLTTKGILNSDTSINDNDGILNYIKNGHAEVNALGWATYKDAAGVLPVDGTGGTPTHITFTQTSTAPLGGLGSFLVTNSGSTSAQGEGASYNFTIDTKDKAKVLQISFDYLLNSGTFVAGSSGVDSDLEVYIYDVTNALIIQPSSYKLLSNNTTLTDKFSATFQTASNSTSYRLILHCPTTATAAWSIKLDNVTVSPSQYVYGSPVTDWVAYTPTVSWTTGVTPIGKYKRIGDSISIQLAINVTSTLSGTTGLTFTIPSGLNIDLTKWPTPSQATESLWGIGSITRAAVQEYPCTAVYAGPTTFTVRQFSVAGTTVNATPAVTQTSPQTWLNGDSLFLTVNNIPITGWSSNVQMSDSADTRVVAARFTIPASSSVTAGNPINFLTSSIDTHSAVTVGAAWKFIAPVSGLYMVSANLNTVLANTIRVYKGGTSYQYIASNAVSVTASGSCLVSMNTGEYIDIRPDVTSTTQVVCSVDIQRLTGPSAIAATETVAARYSVSAGASTTTANPINFDTKDFDSHGAVTTGAGVWKFTAPISGVYAVTNMQYFGATSTTCVIFKNGSNTSINMASSLANTFGINGNTTIKLNAGEYIDIRPSATVTPTISGTVAGANFICITKVGN